jgi:glutamyl-tRNA synthetase/glutamyl-Q tRNA(Asp) synthetase
MLAEKLAPGWKRGRFAPSTSGRVHPGTLIAGLLCWLDARSMGAEVVLRLEDLDQARTKPGYVEAIQSDLEWFGLEWDSISLQSENRGQHDRVLAALVSKGLIYACDCSRAKIRSSSRPAPDGSYRYPGTCRSRRVFPGEWRDVDCSLRLRLEPVDIPIVDEGGLDLSGDAERLFGDPILRRRDGVHAYHFASVVDDEDSGVDRVIRGRDLAPSTSLQVALQRVIGIATPAYRHHLLFMERTGAKLSKLHGAVDLDTIRTATATATTAEELCGRLAAFVGLVPPGTICRPSDLVSEFTWDRVRADDVEIAWDAVRGLVVVS